MNYRVYLYDGLKIVAAENFAAHSDEEALEVAATLYSAAKDTFDKYEVWSGTKHLVGDTGSRRADALRARLQRLTVELEERLVNSFACVRRSQQLLDEIDRLNKL
jgi:hypothetical protein